jgi:hypothetical protein
MLASVVGAVGGCDLGRKGTKNIPPTMITYGDSGQSKSRFQCVMAHLKAGGL